MNLILEGLLLIILIEATTNILSKSALFGPWRALFDRHKSRGVCKFLYKAFDCPYCLSVWVSMFYVGMFCLYINNLLPYFFVWFFVVLIFHRLSNMLHFIVDRLDRNYNVFLDKDEE